MGRYFTCMVTVKLGYNSFITRLNMVTDVQQQLNNERMKDANVAITLLEK